MIFEKLSKEDEELVNSSSKIQKGIWSIFSGKKINEETLEQLEELLVASDLNMGVVNGIINFIKNNKYSKDISIDDIKKIIFDKLQNILKNANIIDIDFLEKKPCVMLFLGVNGSGKTTIIGKIANKLKKEGKKVLLSACDTFRAGAVQQLEVWSKRAAVDIIKPEKEGEEPASLAYKSFEKAKTDGYDVLLIDTAGRLQNNVNLVNELAKIIKVLKKLDVSVPHQVVLVLDATIGQNSYRQFELFDKAVNVDSIIVNKLDSTSKAGILMSLVEKFRKPIFAVGVGENIESIKSFDSTEFLKNLLNM